MNALTEKASKQIQKGKAGRSKHEQSEDKLAEKLKTLTVCKKAAVTGQFK